MALLYLMPVHLPLTSQTTLSTNHANATVALGHFRNTHTSPPSGMQRSHIHSHSSRSATICMLTDYHLSHRQASRALPCKASLHSHCSPPVLARMPYQALIATPLRHRRSKTQAATVTLSSTSTTMQLQKLLTAAAGIDTC